MVQRRFRGASKKRSFSYFEITVDGEWNRTIQLAQIEKIASKKVNQDFEEAVEKKPFRR